jgi:hypothetical protein
MARFNINVVMPGLTRHPVKKRFLRSPILPSPKGKGIPAFAGMTTILHPDIVFYFEIDYQ